MSLRFLPIAAAVLALVFASGNASAQAKKAKRSDSRMVPVLNRDSGKLEAVLLLEPATGGTGARWHFGKTTLEATYGLQTGDSLALLCDRRSGLAPAIGQLASNCVLASLDDKPGSTGPVGRSSPGNESGASMQPSGFMFL